MKQFRTRMMPLALVVLAALAPVLAAAPALAQTDPNAGPKPMAVITLSSFDELMGDVNFIGKLMDMPALSQMVQGGLAAITQGKGLDGLDNTKPLGAVIQGAGDPLAFVPVKDLKKLLAALAGVAGPAEEGENGIYEIVAGPQTIYLKEKGGWAFIAKSSEALGSLPADPLKLLDGLDKEYDLGVRLYVQNIPKPFRDLAIEQLKQGAELGLDRLPDEDEEQYELRKKVVQNQLKSMDMLVNETDQVTIGFSIDAKKETTYFDVSFTALPDTKLARATAQLVDAKSAFSGFLLPGAAVKFNVISKSGEKEDIAQALQMIDALRSRAIKAIEEDADLPDENSKKIVKSALTDLIDVLKATIEGGKFDAGAALLLEPDSLSLVGGGLVADTKKLEGALKKIAELAATEPGFEGVKWDADKHGDVRFHTMTVPIPDEEAQKLLGESLDVALGIGDKSVYVAFGKDSLSTLKSAIDKSKSSADQVVVPFQMAVSLGKIMKFAAEQDDDPTTAMIAQLLSAAEGKDHIRLSVKGKKNGFLYRIEAEDGVLKALAKAAGAAVGGGLGG